MNERKKKSNKIKSSFTFKQQLSIDSIVDYGNPIDLIKIVKQTMMIEIRKPIYNTTHTHKNFKFNTFASFFFSNILLMATNK